MPVRDLTIGPCKGSECPRMVVGPSVYDGTRCGFFCYSSGSTTRCRPTHRRPTPWTPGIYNHSSHHRGVVGTLFRPDGEPTGAPTATTYHSTPRIPRPRMVKHERRTVPPGPTPWDLAGIQTPTIETGHDRLTRLNQTPEYSLIQ